MEQIQRTTDQNLALMVKYYENKEKEELQHFMQCRLGDCCNACKEFLEGFKQLE